MIYHIGKTTRIIRTEYVVKLVTGTPVNELVKDLTHVKGTLRLSSLKIEQGTPVGTEIVVLKFIEEVVDYEKEEVTPS